MKIIAIDPGGVTGWARFEFQLDDADKPKLQTRIEKHFTGSGQFESQNHHRALWMFLDEEKPDIVVCERFENRNNDFTILVSVEYIGVVRAWCQMNNVFLKMQGASQALFLMTTEKMYVLGLVIEPYTPNKDANAAKKHLVFFLINWRYRAISNMILFKLKPIG
jgi:hypothetical protein